MIRQQAKNQEDSSVVVADGDLKKVAIPAMLVVIVIAITTIKEDGNLGSEDTVSDTQNQLLPNLRPHHHNITKDKKGKNKGRNHAVTHHLPPSPQKILTRRGISQ